MKSVNPLLTFESDGRVFACDLLWIREILRRPLVRYVDGSPPIVRGLIHLRGQILTALDLEARLGRAVSASPPTERCIVFKTATDLDRQPNPPDDAGLARNDMSGILVDKISEIIPPNTELLPAPPEALSGMDSSCISGVIPLRGTLATVLKIGTLLAASNQSSDV